MHTQKKLVHFLLRTNLGPIVLEKKAVDGCSGTPGISMCNQKAKRYKCLSYAVHRVKRKERGGGLLPSVFSLKTSSQRPGFSIAAKVRIYGVISEGKRRMN